MIKKIIKNIILKWKIACYTYRYPNIERNVFSKDRINVIFFVLYESMWKSDSLFKLLKSSDRFHPMIVSMDYPNHPEIFRRENQDSLRRFFTSRGYEFYSGYNFGNNTWLDIKKLNPDIIVYPQPYNAGYKGFRIEAFWHSCLFAYIPYCYRQEKGTNLHNTLLLNIAWKLFYPDSFHKKEAEQLQYNKGSNVCVTGYPLADNLITEQKVKTQIWKKTDAKLKKIIWAPHHSILPDDALRYATFLDVNEFMLTLADKYKNEVQFIFKPHPALKRKLYDLSGWGISRTDSYYKKWEEMENTTIAEGDYVDIFKSSDAMIHDCSSFSGEYLYTKKPVLFLTKSNHENYLSDFGLLCYAQHYKARSLQEIEDFIVNVVIKEDDYMIAKRNDFFNEYLLPPNNSSVANNIFKEFINSLVV